MNKETLFLVYPTNTFYKDSNNELCMHTDYQLESESDRPKLDAILNMNIVRT